MPTSLPETTDFSRYRTGELLGLYLHVPFCTSRCSYCAFASSTKLSRLDAYLQKLLEDLKTWGRLLHRPSLDTIYLGGGTPSLLSLEALEALWTALKASFDLTNLQECTLEANPGNLDPIWLMGARRLGWDRLSLGVQSLDHALLRRLGRPHGPEEALDALRMTREAGFQRLSGDLMLGIPTQNLADTLQDVQQLLETDLDHLSVYLLDLDKSSPLSREIEAGILLAPSEDELADQYLRLHENLSPAGWDHYEISNFSKPGAESLHNRRYWERRPYLGLGPSASSQMANDRWTEHPDLEAWIHGAPLVEFQRLTPLEELAEIPLLGLRLARGIHWEELRSRARAKDLPDPDELWAPSLEPFLKADLLKREGPWLQFTPEGWLQSNPVFQIFV